MDTASRPTTPLQTSYSTHISILERVFRYTILSLFTGVCYFGSLHISLFPEQQLVEHPVFLSIPFNPDWAIIYQSIYLVAPATALLLYDRKEFKRFTLGFTYMVLFSTVFFLLLPVTYPGVGEKNTLEENWMFQLILTYDRPKNCLPSLHMGFAVFCSIFIVRRFSRHQILALLAPLLALSWIAAVAYSTLALKQHYFVDLPLGAVVALTAFLTVKDSE
jgi:hypothetical protein